MTDLDCTMMKSFKDFSSPQPLPTKTKKTRILAENIGELEVLTSNADNDSQRFAQRLSALRQNIRHCAAAHAEQFYGLLSADDLRDADLLKTYGLTVSETETYVPTKKRDAKVQHEGR